MTKKEALEIVRTASGLAVLNRQDHVKVLQALELLEKEISGEKE